MTKLIVEQVTKTFGRLRALDRVSLAVQPGEFLTILGPSGSGKSTLLRLIAGLELPDAGRVVIGGRVVCNGPEMGVAAGQRHIGMVFQNYALWPHMTAFENVAFPLEMAGLRRPEITARVREVMALVELSGLAQKRPGQMSGGEQQRVALARALVGRPAILLMDECLSNLDARLREKMAAELRRIQETIGITTIYVTHDQQEALALSDRIAVLHRGVLQQVGSPGQLYRSPCNSLVAASLGAINLLSPAEARRLGLRVDLPDQAGHGITLGVRPEDIVVVPNGVNGGSPGRAEGARGIPGRVKKVTFMGSAHHCWIEIGQNRLQVQLPPAGAGNHAGVDLLPGDRAWVIIEPQSLLVLNADIQPA